MGFLYFYTLKFMSTPTIFIVYLQNEKGLDVEILYSAIEEKQAEIEDSLVTIHQRQQQIRQDFKCDENPEEFTKNDRACIQLQELNEQEKVAHEEFDILTQISKTNGDFEEIRLAARDAHTCMLNENEFGTCMGTEEQKLNQYADNCEHKYQECVLDYRRLKKIPPEHLSQEELLSLYMDMERKIAKEKIKRDLFTIMAERILYEMNRSKQENILDPYIDGIAI
jgi:hypothetical protein